MRKIPSTMGSQHPDHASLPYWHNHEYITTHDETKETFLSYSELGIQEYKWDWEGKYVDESVIERLYSTYLDYFQKNPLGKDLFLTFRLPNPKVESEFRVGRSFMNILAANGLAEMVGAPTPALFEVILPMTESAEEILAIQQAFKEMAGLKHKLYRFSENGLKHIEVIPLFEQVQTIAHSDEILDEYLELHKKEFGYKPEYLRPYTARSDPALNSGIIPTVLAIKIALSKYRRYEESHNIALYPIIGTAALPFRGGLTPYRVKQFVNEYQGVRTALIQSAFRYDYPKEDVIKGLRELDELLPKKKARFISKKEEEKLQEIIKRAEAYYRPTVEGIALLINTIAKQLPKRRERVQHIGLFGYSRGVGSVKLPRAIGFTAALYSIGVPPELIGTGRTLHDLMKNGTIEVLEKYYLNLRYDLEEAGRYVNKEVLDKLAVQSPIWNDIKEDVAGIEEYLRHEIGPKTKEDKQHQAITGYIYAGLCIGNDITQDIQRAAVIRRSLG
ncbi:phosphoenolpyruvate carboxylase [Candidatus Roizmanbacteria bacterium]|nr:phosphoenolpyruvate carboxylase [Candidatus Roizmanbacteria bacterium]